HSILGTPWSGPPPTGPQESTLVEGVRLPASPFRSLVHGHRELGIPHTWSHSWTAAPAPIHGAGSRRGCRRGARAVLRAPRSLGWSKSSSAPAARAHGPTRRPDLRRATGGAEP